MASPPVLPEVALIGHPFAPIGMGEHVRCSFRALRSVGLRPRIIDIYGLNQPEPDAAEELRPFVAQGLAGVNVFHINGDEVEQALATLAYRPSPPTTYNVIYPAWELARYPREWATQLERFDELWAPSRFIADSLAAAVSRPVVHMPLACEVLLSYFVGRRWFGIPEASFAFLFFFDLRSYASRKNPQAVLQAFERALRHAAHARVTLVLKVNGAETAPAELARLKELIEPIRSHVLLIERTLTDNEVKNLVRACDCFVSLHRSEGFGRGLIEAMYLGKPVIGTRYSGNLDFMDDTNSLLVDYALVPVGAGEYPHWEGQVWAEPDVEQAARFMRQLLERPEWGVAVGRRAALHVREHFSLRPAGWRFLERLRAIQAACTRTASATVN